MQFIDNLKWKDYKKFLASDTINYSKKYKLEYSVESLTFSGSKDPSKASLEVNNSISYAPNVVRILKSNQSELDQLTTEAESLRNLAAKKNSGDGQPVVRGGVSYTMLETERIWTLKHYSQLSKVQIMGVGSDLIDRKWEGWT
jgi:hypothetical protein